MKPHIFAVEKTGEVFIEWIDRKIRFGLSFDNGRIDWYCVSDILQDSGTLADDQINTIVEAAAQTKILGERKS